LTKVTTGNYNQDIFLKNAVGLKTIGKSILDLPVTINDFESIYDKYLIDIQSFTNVTNESQSSYKE